MKKSILAFLLGILCQAGSSQNVQITVKVLSGRKAISPYIYGRNNSLSDNAGSPVPAATWQLYKDAGVNFFRENGGNNLSKYNWRLKLSSHPDWYNNVYASDWDYAAQSLQQNIPGSQGMWGFQLIGQAAGNTAHNFNDFAYNASQWWSGVEQNLAGGGVPNTAGGSQALTNGDTSLYLEHWTSDSTTAILNHWFGAGGLGLDPNGIRYWNMDNEVEIWSSTHDDVMPTQLSAEAFMQRYFAVAKKARALYPNIRLTGPVSPNEWQWYNWNNSLVTGADGKQYPWLEFFIRRLAEEEQSTGIRLLDVIDLHFYPSSSSAANVVQYHRVFFDSTYLFPEANGVKVVNGGWDNSIQIEDIFGRCQNWLNQYMGPGNGVTFAISETATQLQNDPNSLAVWYGSTMGEFMNHGVEFFSPWNWDYGMWEALHLYSRYNKNISVQAISSDESNVSAYASANNTNDSVTVALVNRSLSQPSTVTLNFPDFQLAGQAVSTLTLAGLPVGRETFVSHTNNALVPSTLNPQSDNTLQVTLAPLSITSVLIKGAATPLPVTLLSFTAARANAGVVLDFATTDAVNLSSFVIERSADGQNFSPIGSVPAAAGQAKNASEADYTFRDGQPLLDVNYYRLKMIDQDKRFTYSRVVVIHIDEPSAAVALFPNPATDVVNLQFQLPAGQLLLRITDAAGRVVRTSLLSSSGTEQSASIDVNSLAKGVYYLSIGNVTRRFVKK
jgi:hypothetical protein